MNAAMKGGRTISQSRSRMGLQSICFSGSGGEKHLDRSWVGTKLRRWLMSSRLSHRLASGLPRSHSYSRVDATLFTHIASGSSPISILIKLSMIEV